jgi:hypothetical protein
METTIYPNDPFESVKKHLIKFSVPQDYLAWKSIGATVIYETFAIALIFNGQ